MPYGVCGCDPDPDNSGNRTSCSVSKVLHKDSTSSTVDSPRPDLVSLANEDADPSEHDHAVIDTSAKVMTGDFKADMCYHNVENASLNPKHDTWVSTQAERNQRRTKRDGDKETFIDPYVGAGTYYPYWGISMVPAFG